MEPPVLSLFADHLSPDKAAFRSRLLETAKGNGHNPRLWLTRVLETIGRNREFTDHTTLLPWAMEPEPPTA